jgi:hypothetical protein
MQMRANRILQVSLDVAELKRQYQADLEIQTFLKAISSYPDSFSRDPELSFEDHLFTVIAQNDQPHFA